MNSEFGRKLRILVLVHEDLVPPESVEGLTEKEMQPWKTEYDVIATLQNMGHEVYPIGLYSDLGVIREAFEKHKPHIAFNLLEEFHGLSVYDQHVVSYLELMKQPYTGCNPRGLTLSHDKALSKKILAYHRLRVPAFAVFPTNRRVYRPKNLEFPLLVKSISEEGSVTISQASIVYDDEKLAERVRFVHRQTNSAAIAEQYIDGREIYVGVIGNGRLRTFTPWELHIKNLPPGAPYIATDRIKWNYKYQEKVGVHTEAAQLSPERRKQLDHISKRVYRALSLSGYARIDYRLSKDGQLYVLEANPNPNISFGEDFAEAAEHCGVSYKALLQKIINLGLSYSTH
ncbi:MAG: ATP-grasp domain-containing protein [Acidobacteriota bacterium]